MVNQVGGTEGAGKPVNKKTLFLMVATGLCILILVLVYFNGHKEGGGFISPFAPAKITQDTKSVDPDQYSTVKDFVANLTPASGGLDLAREDFVISVPEGGSGMTTYTRFKQNEIGENSQFVVRDIKNKAIQDIFSAYKSGEIFATSSYTGSVSKILFDDETGFPATKDLSLIIGMQKNLYKTIKDLEASADTKYDREYLAFLYEFSGNYEKAAAARRKLCGEKECTPNIPFTFSGRILDESGKPVEWAKVTLLNKTTVSTVSDKDGYYLISSEIHPFSLDRFRVSKDGYADSFHSVLVNQAVYAGTYPAVYNFTLFACDNTVKLGAGNLTADGHWEFESKLSKYRVAKDAFSYINGKLYSGQNITVNLYEFSKERKMSDLLKVDVLSPDYGYVGGGMSTAGMPYMQFFDENGNELFVRSSKSMLVRSTFSNMKELKEGSPDSPFPALTDADIDYIVKASTELGGFPINYDWLIRHNLLKWPAWWALDRKTGTWDNIGERVVDASGIIEAPFYSIKDGTVSVK